MDRTNPINAEDLRGKEISPWTVSFRDRAFEARFQRSWQKASKGVNRIWVIGGIGFYALMTVLLITLFDSEHHELVWIRYTIALPIMVAAQIPLFWNRQQIELLGLGYLVGTLTAFGTSLALFTFSHLDHHLVYLVEMFAVLAFSQQYNRIQFKYSLTFSATAVSATLLAIALKPEIFSLPFGLFAAAFIAFGFVGVLANYEREIFVRRNYLSMQAFKAESERSAGLATEAVAASEAKSRFLAIVTHELRTPLNIIIGYAETIKTGIYGKIEAPKAMEAIDDIHTSGTNLLEIVNELLELTRAEIGSIELNEREIDVPSLLTEVQQALEGQRTQHGVDITVVCDETMAPLHADERLVRRMLTNLVGNAIKYTPKGGEVWIYAIHFETGELILEVKDTGIGIAPDKLEKVMAPFGQADDDLNRRYEGVGLGLPLVKGFVELHGGSMRIESTKGQGTTVQLRFPPERMQSSPMSDGVAAPEASSVAAE